MKGIYFFIPVAIFLAVIIFYLALKSMFEIKKEEDKNNLEKVNLWEGSIAFYRNFSLFFFLMSVVLWLGIILIYSLQDVVLSDTYSKILSTGIHIPIIMLICTLIIRGVKQICLKKYNISDSELGNSVFAVLFFIDVPVFFFDWELALLILSIILGKIIWYGTKGSEIVDFVKQMMAIHNKTNASLTGLTLVYCRILPWFLILVIIFSFAPTQ